MIISFTVKNWRSFRDETTLSMVAGREMQHRETLSLMRKPSPKLLPVAAIYGANASGKSNLFGAMGFMRNFIVHGAKPDEQIPVDPFILDKNYVEAPTTFVLVFVVEAQVYELSFTISRREVLEESLVQRRPSSEKTVYRREGTKLLFQRHGGSKRSLDAFLTVYQQSMRPNQLFLTTGVDLNIEELKPVYNWFRDYLQLISPKATFTNTELLWDKADPLSASVSSMLEELDTGIQKLSGEDVPLESLSIVSVVPGLAKSIGETLSDGETVALPPLPPGERYAVTKVNGQLIAKRLVSYHRNVQGDLAKFSLTQESDGTVRLIDLLPGFVDMAKTNSTRIYFIDELDRSLHSMLTWNLIESFLESCNADNRSQLIFTTHDLHLMDQDLLRRDEMYLTDRTIDGSTSLTGFCEYKDIRSDKDIRRSYLAGRLGGIPKLPSAYSRCPDEERGTVD